MKQICLTNDDGPTSYLLTKLAEKLCRIGDLLVIVPHGQRSATGKSLSLNKPLRATEQKTEGDYRLITHTGTPADSVILSQMYLDSPDLFVSGINAGINVGYQSMLTSGTVGAALEAALLGFPALALSQRVKPSDWFGMNIHSQDCENMCNITCNIVERMLERGMPKGVDVLNLNFPSEINAETEVVVTKPARIRMANEVEERLDPNDSPYYWLRGVVKDAPEGSDVYEVIINGNISLSPIIIESVDDEHIASVRDFLN